MYHLRWNYRFGSHFILFLFYLVIYIIYNFNLIWMIMVLRSAITERQIVDKKTREKNHRKWLWELIHHTLEKFFDISDTRPVTVYLDSVTYNLCVVISISVIWHYVLRIVLKWSILDNGQPILSTWLKLDWQPIMTLGLSKNILLTTYKLIEEFFLFTSYAIITGRINAFITTQVLYSYL